MKKKNLLLFAALALSASAGAQEVVTVTSTDGKKEFDKGQITTFTFDGPAVILHRSGNQEPEEYMMSDIVEITFSLATGFDNVKMGETNITVSAERGTGILRINGTEPGKIYNVAVYDAAGRIVWNDKQWQGQTIDFSGKPAGVYILNINNTTLKFRK